MTIRLNRETLEYVTFPLTATPVDPTTLVHQVAVVDEAAQPLDTDWFNAVYDHSRVHVLIRASTNAPVGGDITLSLGRWRVWWKSSSLPEYPVRQVGVVQVV